jgi:hypothetical protein
LLVAVKGDLHAPVETARTIPLIAPASGWCSSTRCRARASIGFEKAPVR